MTDLMNAIIVVCEGQITLSEEYIGQNKDVLVQYSTCPGYGSNVNTLDTRQIVDVCGNPCMEKL
jgi:hypothetical protein